MNCVHDCFQFPHHLDSHIPSLRDDLVRAVFSCVWTRQLLQRLWFFTCSQMLMHLVALKADTERKIPCVATQGCWLASAACQTPGSTKWAPSLPQYFAMTPNDAPSVCVVYVCCVCACVCTHVCMCVCCVCMCMDVVCVCVCVRVCVCVHVLELREYFE